MTAFKAKKKVLKFDKISESHLIILNVKMAFQRTHVAFEMLNPFRPF